MIKLIASAALAGAWLVAGLAAPASARTADRVWVSGHGKDVAGCGAPTNPCRTFQYVHDSIISSGGEIDVLDPAGYGPITITKALSIVNGGVGAAGVEEATAGKNAITINAGTKDNIYLQGLTVEGLGTGENGVQFNSGASLTIAATTISEFKGTGVNFTPNNGAGVESALAISGGSVASNGAAGVEIKPAGGTQARATLKNVGVSHSAAGVTADGSGSADGWAQAILSDCELYDLTTAVTAKTTAGVAYVVVERSAVAHATTGLSVSGAKAVVDISGSALVYDLTISSAASGGVLRTFGNNTIDFFATLGALTPASLK